VESLTYPPPIRRLQLEDPEAATEAIPVEQGTFTAGRRSICAPLYSSGCLLV
jgi:hypothetical protein